MIHVKYIIISPLVISKTEFLLLKMSYLKYLKEGVFLRHSVCEAHTEKRGEFENEKALRICEYDSRRN